MQSVSGSGLILSMAQDERKDGNSSGVDLVWNGYMQSKRDVKELVGLVQNPDIDPIYQQRAMQVLLVPHVSELPFKVNIDDSYRDNFLRHTEWIDNITAEQAIFVAKKVSEHMQALRGKHVDEDETQNLEQYNDLIPGLLKKLPMYEASKLFDSFSINDITPFWSMDDMSGYNPMGRLLQDSDIHITWKRRAANEMHQIIINEQKGASPREEHENAYERYKDILNYMITNGSQKVNLDDARFFRDEVGFMVGINAIDPVIFPWNLGHALDLIEDSSVRYELVNRAVFADSFNFSVDKENDALLAARLIGEFSYDSKLTNALENMLIDRQLRLKEELRKKRDIERQEANILLKMSRSSDTIS